MKSLQYLFQVACLVFFFPCDFSLYHQFFHLHRFLYGQLTFVYEFVPKYYILSCRKKNSGPVRWFS